MQRSIIAPAERVTNLRWGIALLLGAGTFVAAIDQVNLIVAGRSLAREFGTNFAGLGLLFSVLGWTYAAAQIPAGMLLDRFGVTAVGRIAALCGSLFALATAAVGSQGMLFAARIGLALAAAPVLPINAKATGYWFPEDERGFATAIFDCAGKFAIAIGFPIVALILMNYGWRATFLFSGILSAIFCVAFYAFYRNPAEDKRLTHAEREHIKAGRAQEAGRANTDALVYLLWQPKVWGLTIGFASYAYAFYFLLMWSSIYFLVTFKLNVVTAALYAAIPWLVAALADLFVGGFLVDALIRGGMDATRVRKTILVIGMLLGTSVVGAITAHDPTIVIVYMSMALCGLSIASPVSWSIPALIAPRGMTGTLASIMNFAKVVMAIVSPIVVGYILMLTPNGSFANPFLAAAIVLIAGILSYVFLLGRIEPIPEPA